MKFLVLFACVAAASAQLVTYPNGAVAPVETPEVQAAKAAHFAAQGATLYAGAAYPYAYGAYGLNHYAGAYAYGYNGLQAYPNGAIVPVDEPAVQAAKAEHFAAKGLPIAPVAVAPYANYAPLGYANAYAYGYNGLQAYPNGAIVPVDEPAVQAAKAEHFAAKGLAYAGPAYAPAAYYGPALTVHSNGAIVPVEPAEVQEARAAHLANF